MDLRQKRSKISVPNETTIRIKLPNRNDVEIFKGNAKDVEMEMIHCSFKNERHRNKSIDD